MKYLPRCYGVFRHLLTFLFNFAHGGVLVAGMIVIGLAGYQIHRYGVQGLSPRMIFGFSAVSAYHRAGTEDLTRMLEDSVPGASVGLDPGMDRIAAVVARRHHVSPLVVNSMLRTVHREAQADGVDPLLILAVITVESGFNPFAESQIGAQGLMQVMPVMHTGRTSPGGHGTTLFDPEENIHVGTLVLKDCLRDGGSVEAALQRYGAVNGDLDATYVARVMQELEHLRQIAAPSSSHGVASPASSANSVS